MADFLSRLVDKLAENLTREGPKRIQYAQQATQARQRQKAQANTSKNELATITPKAYGMAQKEADKTGTPQPIEKYIRMLGYQGTLPQELYKVTIPKQPLPQGTPERPLPNVQGSGIPNIPLKPKGTARDTAEAIYKSYLNNEKGTTDFSKGKVAHVPEAAAIKLYEKRNSLKIDNKDKRGIAKQLRLINTDIRKNKVVPNFLTYKQQTQVEPIVKPITVAPNIGGKLILDDGTAQVLLSTHPYLLTGLLNKPDVVTNLANLTPKEIETAVGKIQKLAYGSKDIDGFERETDRMEKNIMANFGKYAPLTIHAQDIPSLATTAPYYVNAILGKQSRGGTLPAGYSSNDMETIGGTFNSLAKGLTKNE